MWLSLNLILLVFFMLLNSMAQPGEPHPEAAMVDANDVQTDMRTDVTKGQDAPTAPQMAWRQDVITRLHGAVMNRMDLRVLPQGSDANELRVEIPLEEVFREDSTLRRPELVARLRAAAGKDSTMAWGLMAPYDAKGVLAGHMALLSRMTKTPVAWEDGEERVVRIQIRPGVRTDVGVGTSVQKLSDEINGQTQGVDAGGAQ